MTEVNERYKRGKIYSLRSHQTDLVYIGSTIQSLSKRIGGHRDNYKGLLKGSFPYMTSFEIIKYDDAYIELVENYPCNTKAELERREGQIMRDTENCCNKCIVGRTKSEYYQDNIERIVERDAKYRQANKEKYAEYQAKYRQENKEKRTEYQAKYQAEYQAKNKDKIKEQKAEYYAKNKEKLSEKVKCDCGSEVRKYCLKQHLRSQKHQNYLLTLNQD